MIPHTWHWRSTPAEVRIRTGDSIVLDLFRSFKIVGIFSDSKDDTIVATYMYDQTISVYSFDHSQLMMLANKRAG
jgi:hypothetical protein